MKIAIYTLTRERLDYTKTCFSELKLKAGMPFYHVVVDNGSEDGTALWLHQEYSPFVLRALPRNIGISKGSNLALDIIFRELPDVDLIIKMDNDCKVLSDDILAKISGIYEAVGKFAGRYVLSPRVLGINRQPTRGRLGGVSKYTVGFTAIVGGLFHIVPAEIYRGYRYPVDLPLAAGQDDHFCNYVKRNGAEVGYLEELQVEHIEGTTAQAKRYPAYFERKWKEEKSTDAGSSSGPSEPTA